MKKAIATVLSVILSGALLVYAGSRAYDFIAATMPAGQQAVAFMALAATEGGIVIWLLYFLFGAAGQFQRGISMLMVIVDLIGSFALYTFDTLYRSGQAGQIAALSGDEVRGVILGLNALILLNVAASVACHLMDPDAQRRGAEQEARDTIETKALSAISRDAESLAAELAPGLAAQWVRDMRAKYNDYGVMGFERAEDTTTRRKVLKVQPTPNPAPSLTQSLFKRVNLPRRTPSRLRLRAVANLQAMDIDPNLQAGEDLK